jgi:hypothetical protein
MKAALEKLTGLSHKVAEQMYKTASANSDAPGSAEAGAAPGKKEDEPIEAEFREDKGSAN